MRKLVVSTFVVGVIAAVASAALAFGPGGGYGPGYMMGRGMMGAWDGQGAGPGGFTCPGWAGASGQAQQQVTEDQAKAAATEYVTKYFPGYSIERVLPFAGRFRTMYQVELKGPKGESRLLHVNPWGQVRPFGPGVIGG